MTGSDSTLIAVVGTLSGVAITAASGILVSVLTARHQRQTAELQAEAAMAERSRRELREALVEYLSAYSDLRDKIVLLERHRRALEQDDSDVPTIEEYAPAESARFSRSYHTLRITANNATGEAANRATAQLWEVSRAAQLEEYNVFAEKFASGRPFRRELRAAMRKELGVD